MKANHSGVDYKEGLKKQNETPSKIKQAHTRSMENGCCRQFWLLFLTLSFTLTQRRGFFWQNMTSALSVVCHKSKVSATTEEQPTSWVQGSLWYTATTHTVDTGLQSFVSICRLPAYNHDGFNYAENIPLRIWFILTWRHHTVNADLHPCCTISRSFSFGLRSGNHGNHFINSELIFFKRPVWALCILLEAPLEDGCNVVIKG